METRKDGLLGRSRPCSSSLLRLSFRFMSQAYACYGVCFKSVSIIGVYVRGEGVWAGGSKSVMAYGYLRLYPPAAYQPANPPRAGAILGSVNPTYKGMGPHTCVAIVPVPWCK